MSINISIIVPVFNTAPYLTKCLDSLCAQRSYDLEFILVDDGSTDDSAAIMKEYAAKDERFKLIFQKNRGTAAARNCGLKEAEGEYIGFVDSDDWIEPDMYQLLWECHLSLPEADIVQCSCIHEYSEEKISIPCDNRVIIKSIAESGGVLKGAENLLLDDATIWNRIFRRTMLEEKQINFKEDMMFGEDLFFHCKALIFAQKISVRSECLYHYLRNRPKAHTSSSDRRIFSYFKTISQINQLISENNNIELVPWVNHLTLSYLTWGFERLDPQLHQEYFEQYQNILAEMGINRKSPISYPSFSGNLMYDLRYFLLRILHPLTLKAIINKDIGNFKRIVWLRHFLADLPLKLRCCFSRRNGKNG